MTTSYTKNFGLALPDFRMGPWHDLINQDIAKIDGLIYGAMSTANSVPWENSKHYVIGVTVIDTDTSTTWMCNFEHTSAATGTFAADRAAHPTYWIQVISGFAPRGEWAQNTQYYPYDLTYDSVRGIFALCKTKHISNSLPGGSIKDDEVYWSFLVDFSTIGLSTASTVTYSNATSGLAATNVQDAIDQVEGQIVSLNNVNIAQGNSIIAIQNVNTTQDSRLTAVESKNTTQDSQIAANTAAIAAGGFPSGTRMMFFNAAPPAGWSMVAWNNMTIRVVNDASGGSTGGVQPFSTVFGRTATDGWTLNASQMPSHTHSYVDTIPNAVGAMFSGASSAVTQYSSSDVGKTTGSAGGDQPHSHGLDLRVQYVNACVGQKT